MKTKFLKSIYSLAIILLAVSVLPNHYASATVSNTKSPIKISIHGSIGVKKRDCAGFSICDFDISISWDPAASVMSYDPSTGDMVLTFIPEDIGSKVKYFTGDKVYFEEAFDVPVSAELLLKTKNDLKIPVGYYEWKKVGDNYQIYIPGNN